jgi:Zn-dependent peptidase ImmA (M78 family)
MDAALEAHARDAEWLLGAGHLTPPSIVAPSLELKASGAGDDQPQNAARAMRKALDLPEGPIGSLADVCGRAGLHLLVVPGMQAGASLLLDRGFGVAVIGAADGPGRRRLTAAHELGHFILQDAYTTDIGVAASRDAREQRIDLFAVEFILPHAELVQRWEARGEESPRQCLIRVAGEYRVSWSVVVRSAMESGVIDAPSAAQLRSRAPHRGEFLETLGHEPAHDLLPGETSSAWRKATLRAWRSGSITAARAIELLHGAIAEADLPERDEADVA